MTSRADERTRGAAILIALLRGVNIVRAKRVAMADLRALFEDLGYQHVRTLLNSGNVVFTAKTNARVDAARLEGAIEARLHVSCRVFLLTADQLADIVSQNPLTDIATNPSRLLVAVLADPAYRRTLEPLRTRDWGSERLAIGRRAAYMWCPEGFAAGELPEAVARALGDAVTVRNWSTILKLHALTTP